MEEFGRDISLEEVALRAPAMARVLLHLGIPQTSFSQGTVGWALDLLAAGKTLTDVALHVELWHQECDVCWQSSTFATLVTHIEAIHHAFLRAELPRIQLLLHRAVNRETKSNALVAKAILERFAPMKAELEIHIVKEELTLFPILRALDTETLSASSKNIAKIPQSISLLTIEHSEAKSSLEQIRAVGEDFSLSFLDSPLMSVLFTGLRELERDLLAHIREEDDILFARALALADEIGTI